MRRPGYRFFKCRPTDQYGHTATVFFVNSFSNGSNARYFLLFDSCVIPVAPVGRPLGPPTLCGPKPGLRTVVHHAKKFVVGLKYATIEIPDENSHDIGIDQAPDFRFAFCKIVVQTGILPARFAACDARAPVAKSGPA